MKFLFFFLTLTVLVLNGQEPEYRGTKTKTPPVVVKKIADKVIQVGAITLDLNKKELAFPAVYIPPSDTIEVLIATDDSDRLHETLFKTIARPYHLEYMLYLLGADNTTKRTVKHKKGDLINIDIEWQDEVGRKTREPIEAFVMDIRFKAPMVRRGWYFPGSVFYKGSYQAEARGNLCLLYSAPDSVLDNFDPDSYKDQFYETFADRIKPFPMSPVRIIMSLRRE